MLLRVHHGYYQFSRDHVYRGMLLRVHRGRYQFSRDLLYRGLLLQSTAGVTNSKKKKFVFDEKCLGFVNEFPIFRFRTLYSFRVQSI
jgi:hypothetical protein